MTRPEKTKNVNSNSGGRLKRGHHGLHVLHFNDEVPRIGSGARAVEISVGTKWVKLRCPFTLRSAKLRRAVFDQVWAARGNAAARAKAAA